MNNDSSIHKIYFDRSYASLTVLRKGTRLRAQDLPCPRITSHYPTLYQPANSNLILQLLTIFTITKYLPDFFAKL